MDPADRSLWQAWRARRDASAFETLVRPHLGFAVDLARRSGCTQADAEDAVQDALVRLARESGERPVEVGIRAWLGRFVSLRGRAIRREAARRRRREAVAARRAPGPVDAAEPASAVDRAVEDLPEAQRVAVVLRHVHDVDYAEMALVLGVSENACRIRVHRGIEALRRRLGAGAAALLAASPPARAPRDASGLVSGALGRAASPSFVLGSIGGFAVAQKALLVGGAVAALGAGAWLVADPGDREPDPVPAVVARTPPAEPARLSPAPLPPTPPPSAEPSAPAAPAAAPPTSSAALLARIYASGGRVARRRTDARSGVASLEWLDAAPSDLAADQVAGVATARPTEVEWMADLAAFPALSMLVLENVAGFDPERLPVLPALAEVRLERGPVTAVAIGGLGRQPALARLEVGHATVDDAAMRALAALPLTEISFRDTRVGDEALAALSGGTRVRRLGLDDADVTDAGLAHLAQHAGLEHLDLTGARVTGAGFSHLAGLPRLASIVLERARVDDEGLRVAATLPRLERLDLEATDVTDAGVAHLAASPSLVDLNLEKTRVTDAALEPLVRLATLRRLDVGDTRVTADGLARFRAARPDVRARD